jgi:hypothetical protein
MATDFVQEGAVMGDHNGRDWSGCILAQAEPWEMAKGNRRNMKKCLDMIKEDQMQ